MTIASDLLEFFKVFEEQGITQTVEYPDTGMEEFSFHVGKPGTPDFREYRVTPKSADHKTLLPTYMSFIKKGINPFTYRHKKKHWKDYFNVDRRNPPEEVK